MNQTSKESSRSWFCVLNNPANQFGDDVTPNEMVDLAISKWCMDKPHRTCAINYEIGDSGTPHMHMVLEDPAKSRFSAVKKLFPTIHIERTRGNKEQAEDYINKRGRFQEKNHTIVVPAVYRGQIKAAQGSRFDLSVIEELIQQGKTPNQIMDLSIIYRKHESIVKKAYFRKRCLETPQIRKVTVYWHVGESGSGKSYTYTRLVDEHGEENVYLMNDYESGGFDMYEGEAILFMDEFKGNMKFQQLLNYTDVYKTQIHCRYNNSYSLWTEVHITSIYPPEEAYKFMVEKENQSRDKIQQLLRRLTFIVYHYKENNEFLSYTLDATKYSDYEQLKQSVYISQACFHSIDCENPFE